MIYLDTSALAKLVVREPESEALVGWLAVRRSSPLCTSVVGRVELVRAGRRATAPALARAHGVLGSMSTVPLTSGVVELAMDLEPAHLRTLDALHLASALSIGSDLTAFVAYDTKLLRAAESAGIRIASPA